MYTTSISTAQQLAADRHASYEGVATRRRLRKLARRTAHSTTTATPEPRFTLRIVRSRRAAASQPAARKVA